MRYIRKSYGPYSVPKRPKKPASKKYGRTDWSKYFPKAPTKSAAPKAPTNAPTTFGITDWSKYLPKAPTKPAASGYGEGVKGIRLPKFTSQQPQKTAAEIAGILKEGADPFWEIPDFVGSFSNPTPGFINQFMRLVNTPSSTDRNSLVNTSYYNAYANLFGGMEITPELFEKFVKQEPEPENTYWGSGGGWGGGGRSYAPYEYTPTSYEAPEYKTPRWYQDMIMWRI